MERKGETSIINWKVFLVLLMGIVLSTFAIIPYLTNLLSSLQGNTDVSIPSTPILVLISIIEFSLAAFIGLILSKKVNLGAPILEHLIEKKDINIKWSTFFSIALGTGITVAIILLIGDYLFLLAGSEISFFTSDLPSWKDGLIGSVNGGIGEEILYRLFFMTLFVWLFNKIIRNNNSTPKTWTIWVGMIIPAIIMGLMHLPATTALVESLTLLLIVRIILLNGIAAMAFGILYWKKGLLAAMLAHFSADIILHGLLQLLLKS